MDAKSPHADANIFIAVANKTNPTEPLTILADCLDNNIDTPTSSPSSTVTPVRPTASSDAFNPDNFFKAPANINTAADIVTMANAALLTPLKPSPNLSIIVREATKSANSTVIDPNEAISFSGLIIAITRRDPAKIAIDAAILRRMFAFIFFCQDSKQSFTPPNMFLTLSRNLPSPNASFTPDINFFILKSMLASNPPFKTSKPALMSPLLRADVSASPIFDPTSEILLLTFLITFSIACTIFKKPSKPGAANFSFANFPNSFSLFIPF